MKLTDHLEDGFDDQAIPESKGSSEALPAGKYTLQLEHAEETFTKAGTGVMLKCRFAVVDGAYKDQLLFSQYNIKNPNKQAVEIGISELKALAAACKRDWMAVRENTDVLMFIPFTATLGFEKENINPATDKPYPPRNRILRYTPYAAPGREAVQGREAPAAQRTAKPAMKAALPDDEVPF